VVPVVTDVKRVAVSLQWATVEMERRLKLFSKVGVRNIDSFNKRERAKQETMFNEGEKPVDIPPEDIIPDRLPYIVIVVDEMGDLMMQAREQIEGRIVRLAQKARASGIHMILATQRPSADIITGAIKANFTERIALRVFSLIDSRVIIDEGGAEALIGRGDMLHKSQTGTTRAQGTWVSDDEVRAIVDFYKAQGRPVYDNSIKDRLDKVVDKNPDEEGDGEKKDGGEEDGEMDDEKLCKMAMEVIRVQRRASTSTIQRKLRIGYTRAARVMDMLEEKGIIGPAKGNNEPRDILMDLGEPGGVD
jgi:S-DNA-T family DNA segregation ATPase FtsK/SpoIIIE